MFIFYKTCIYIYNININTHQSKSNCAVSTHLNIVAKLDHFPQLGWNVNKTLEPVTTT